MLPVQSRLLSSSCCTLFQASALLEHFLSSDACSDSFARDYLANVVQALHDSMSRKGGLEHFKVVSSQQLVDVRQSAPSFLHKLHTHGEKSLLTSPGPTGKKQSLPAAEDVGQDALDMDVGSALPDAKGPLVGNAMKRRHSAVENGLETEQPCSPSETEGSAYIQRSKKRRTREKHGRDTLYHGADDQNVGYKRKWKEKQETETENAVTKFAAPDSPSLLEKKRRKKKQQQCADTENMESSDNRGSPVSWSVDENPSKKAANKAYKKVELSIRAAKEAGFSVVTPLLSNLEGKEGSSESQKEGKCIRAAKEAGFSVVTPLSSNLEGKEGSSESKKEDKCILFATPLKVLRLETNRADTAIESSLLEFESRASEGKEKSKKKKRK